MRRLLGSTCLVLSACATFRGAQNLDGMTDEEFSRYVARTTAQVGVVVDAAVQEGDLDVGDLRSLAVALRGLASGTVAGGAGVLAEQLDLDAYGVAALTLVILELDAALEERGAYEEGGILGVRGRAVLESLAMELDLRAAVPDVP